jgi:hypothetical protein
MPHKRWARWWQGLSANRQDQVATLAPLLSVVLFLAAIFSAIAYFTLEEIDREQQAVHAMPNTRSNACACA